MLVASCLGAMLPACGGTHDPLHTLQAPIIDGDPDTAHDAVVVVFQFPYQCTGTLIARRLVLTSAHCTDPDHANTISVHFGRRVFDSNGFLSRVESCGVSEVRHAPDFEGLTDTSHDVSVLFLDQPAPEYIREIPPLGPELGLSEDDLGYELLLVGYGQTSALEGGGKRRWVSEPIRWLCTDPAGCEVTLAPDFNHLLKDNTLCFAYENGGTCFGDSGGPALIDRDGTWYVAGVNSLGDDECRLYACHVRVDTYATFLRQFMAEEKSACDSDIQCASGFCTDGICCQTRCAGSCFSCNLPGFEGACTPQEGECGGCQTSGPGASTLWALWILLAWYARQRGV